MTVIATAGHVSHGKSTLVHALTGTDPDRLPAEKTLGRTIDLGFAWTNSGTTRIGFVDVPGHERLVGNMLAGVIEARAFLLVVAADKGWQEQTVEHATILHALGMSNGVVAVTKSDLSNPVAVVEESRQRLARTSMAGAAIVPVSVRTMGGLDVLDAELGRTARRAEEVQSREMPLRLWVDRAFTIRGSGTIVTGTLVAGQTVREGDAVAVSTSGTTTRIREVRTYGERTSITRGPARVALNLTCTPEEVPRGSAVVLREGWRQSRTFDAYTADINALTNRHHLFHIGTSALPCHVRPLGSGYARVVLDRAIPLRVGDYGLLRNPSRTGAVVAALIVCVDSTPLRRRGDAERLGFSYAATGNELRRLGVHKLNVDHFMRENEFIAQGYSPEGARALGHYVTTDKVWSGLKRAAQALAQSKILPTMLTAQLVRELNLPDLVVARALVNEITDTAATAKRKPEVVVNDDERRVLDEVKLRPFGYIGSKRLAELGATPQTFRRLAAQGVLIEVSNGVYVSYEAIKTAGIIMRTLRQPFRVSELRDAIQGTRRVALGIISLFTKRGWLEREGSDYHRFTSLFAKAFEMGTELTPPPSG